MVHVIINFYVKILVIFLLRKKNKLFGKILSLCHNVTCLSKLPLGPVYSERQCQCCDVFSNIDVIKLLKFLTILIKSLQKWLQHQLIRYDTSVDADAPKSIIDCVKGPFWPVYTKCQCQHCNNSAMTLVILFPWKIMGVTPIMGVTQLHCFQ